MNTLSGLLLIAGAALVLVAALGAVRFDDALARMHAAAKAPTLGILLIGIGVALRLGTPVAVAAVTLVTLLQMVAGPVGAHVLGRAVYHENDTTMDGPDELAARNRPKPETD